MAGKENREGSRIRWRIRDLVDLEYFLYTDDQSGAEDNNSVFSPKGRDLYLSRLRHLVDDGSIAFRRLLIRRWLDIRRESETASLPGALYSEVYRVCLVLAALFGLVAGIALAMSLLRYTGVRPLNVSVYMGVAVFSQILLLFGLGVIFFFRAATRSLARGSVLAKLLGRMLSIVFHRARKGAMGSFEGRKRNALAAALGLIQGRKQVYGSLFFWPVFLVMQVFGVCFNSGLLGATLIKLSGSDVAFGWQSTFQVSEGAVFHLVQTIALPWSWMVPPGIAYPSLDAIEGSRIILKEGAHLLTTGYLVSWWPFLCFSVLFYGFLPRLLFLVSGTIIQMRLMARLRFDNSACDRLVRAMITPVVSTAGISEASRGSSEVEGPLISENREPVSGHGGGSYVALVPGDISTDCDGLEEVVARGLALQVKERKIIGEGEAHDKVVLQALEQMRRSRALEGVFVLQEAWQPPIRENLGFLKALRRRLGERTGIVVGLVGKPGRDTVFTLPRDEDVQIWKHRVDALGDPYLGVERLVSHE